MTPKIDKARMLKEVAELEYRALVNAAAQFYLANRSDWLFRWLGCAAAILTALATGSVTDAVKVIVSDPVKQGGFTAVLVIALGVATAALNFLDPKANRDTGLTAGRQLNALRDELRSLRLAIESVRDHDENSEERLKSFRARYAEIEAVMLPIPDHAHAKGKIALRTNVFYKELRLITGRETGP